MSGSDQIMVVVVSVAVTVMIVYGLVFKEKRRAPRR